MTFAQNIQRQLRRSKPAAVPAGTTYNVSLVRRVWVASGLQAPVAEHAFHPVRGWKFDFAWPAERVAVEVQGGIWKGGRHTRGAALKKEWEKLNAAAALGWRILYCEPSDVVSTALVNDLRVAMKYKE